MKEGPYRIKLDTKDVTVSLKGMRALAQRLGAAILDVRLNALLIYQRSIKRDGDDIATLRNQFIGTGSRLVADDLTKALQHLAAAEAAVEKAFLRRSIECAKMTKMRKPK